MSLNAREQKVRVKSLKRRGRGLHYKQKNQEPRAVPEERGKTETILSTTVKCIQRGREDKIEGDKGGWKRKKSPAVGEKGKVWWGVFRGGLFCVGGGVQVWCLALGGLRLEKERYKS